MLLFRYLIYCFPVLVLGSVKIVPEIKELANNNLLTAYQDVKNNVFEVETFEDLRAEDLLKYGVVKVKSTNSVISSERLANQAISEEFPSQSPPVTEADYDDTFYEVSFKDANVTRSTSDWISVGDCLKNEASTIATYTQGWTVTVASGLNAYIQFAQLFSIQPLLGFDMTLTATVSGSMGCNLMPNKRLQFQAIVQTATVSNVKMRKIKVHKSSKFGRKLVTLDTGEWKRTDPYTEVGKNVEVACVTDPNYQNCK